MSAPLAGPFRRLAAAAYDGLLLLAVLFVVTALLLIPTHGEAVTPANVGAWAYGYDALLAVLVAAYFGVAWTARGQTLGMKAWDLRLEADSGALPAWRAVLVRLVCAAPLYLALVGATLMFMAHRTGWAGLACGALPLAANLAVLALTGRGTLDDRLSRTRVVRAVRAVQAAG